MKILKNRIFLSAVCIILAAAISFILLPKFYEDKGVTVTVLRAAQDIPAGTKIQEKHLASVEMGKFGLPDAVINDKAQIIGKIAQSDISAGDFLLPQKLGEFAAIIITLSLNDTKTIFDIHFRSKIIFFN